MKIIFLFIRFFVTSMAILFSACSKEDLVKDSPLNGLTTVEFNPEVFYGTMTDQDGNVYKTVTIGTQTWMAENLRTTTYNDGSTIPIVTDSDEWAALSTGAYCNYNNIVSEDTIATFGRLYNWYAVNTGMLAPDGWHVPTNQEWKTLIEYLGGKDIAGGKLKEVDTSHWDSPNNGATNETGFTAIPAGYRYCEYYYSEFNKIGKNGLWWSSSMSSSTYPYYNLMSNYGHNVFSSYTQGRDGLSVRCVKD